MVTLIFFVVAVCAYLLGHYCGQHDERDAWNKLIRKLLASTLFEEHFGKPYNFMTNTTEEQKWYEEVLWGYK
jgi:hypothetical protein